MRSFDTYRGFIRNVWRHMTAFAEGSQGTVPMGKAIRYWRGRHLEDACNAKANIGLRAKHCDGARRAVMQFIFGQPGVRVATHAINAVLLGYWSNVRPRSRVISRIMRELAPTARTAAA